METVILFKNAAFFATKFPQIGRRFFYLRFLKNLTSFVKISKQFVVAVQTRKK